MSSTREQLIDLLAKQAGAFVSGQWLSESLNISRTAVWKQMNALKKDGYQLEAVSNKGYRIVQGPDKVSSNTIQWGLGTSWLGKEIIHKETLTSTQTTATSLAQEGCAHGTIVLANKQTNGRGRLNRQWYSDHDHGIWLSIVLRPTIPPNQAPQLTLLTATVMVEVIEQIAQVTPAIKWPNDLLLNNKKLAGILTEMHAEHDQIHHVVIGIGLNLNQPADAIDDAIKQIATSVQIETGNVFNKKTTIQLFLEQFERRYQQYIETGFSSVKQVWERYGYKMNEEVHYQTGKKRDTGIIRGISDEGALLLENNEQKIESIYSAEIDWY